MNRKQRKGRKIMLNTKRILVLIIVLFISSFVSEIKAQTTQPELGIRVKEVLTIDGKNFKDLNGNGVLDPYENWQLSIDERARDLLSKMTLEEKAGLLIIPEFPKFVEGRLILPNEHLNQGTRYFMFREKPTAAVIADYNNQLQEAAEASRLGIPVMMISNPRNHANFFTSGQPLPGDQGQFSYWPYPLGLAATRDMELIKDFAKISSREFRASGIRKIYGYSADVVTNPLLSNIAETFGEHPAYVSDIIREIVKGYQGENLNKESVATTIQHYPGGGAKESQLKTGRFNTYPTLGGLRTYHLPPFRAAIDVGATSIMPNSTYPSNASAVQGFPWFRANMQFEEVGFALNKAFINDLLRDELGFLGYVNSDSGAVLEEAWGALDLPVEKRFAKALNAGTNIFSGATSSEPIIQAVHQGLVSEEVINQSALYLIKEMMMLGLFENPYVDSQIAEDVVNNPLNQERADESHRKSIVLLKNNEVLPLKDDQIQQIKLYVEVFPGGKNGENTLKLKEKIMKYDERILISESLADATHALLWVLPSMKSMDGSPKSLKIGADTGIEQVARIIEIQQTVPTILAIDFKNPWLIGDIEPNAASILATFGVSPEAVIDVIRGRFQPVGKLPFTIPRNEEEVLREIGDIPGFREVSSYVYIDQNGNRYGYNFGLSY